MRKNTIDQDFIPPEETIHLCIQASEQRNMDSIAVKTDDVSNNSLTVEDVTTDLDIQSHSLPVNQKVRHLLFSTSVKEELNERLTSLVAQARRHSPGSHQRQKLLTQIINCQVLILKRLPPEVSWKELSKDFGLSIATLSSFYQRQCLPRLRKFAEIEGLF